MNLEPNKEYIWGVEIYDINFEFFEESLPENSTEEEKAFELFFLRFIAVNMIKRSNPGKFKIKEPEIDPLILQYEPILYFHEQEDFYPSDVQTFVENSSLWDSKGANEDELIKAESDEEPVSLLDLTSEAQDTSEWYLQFSENLENKIPDPEKARIEYQELKNSGQAQNT